MSRLFDGVDDQMVYTIPTGGPDLVGATTLLIVLRILVASDTTWMSFIENETSGAAARPSIGRHNSGGLYYVDSAGIGWSSTFTITDSDNWMVLADTRTAGASQQARAHKCVIGGTNSHENVGAFSNNTGYEGGVYRIGGNDDFANIRVAAAAAWDSTALSDAAIEGIASAKTTQSIYDLSPAWLIDDADGLVNDYVGTMDRTSVTGTASDADNPSGWVYGLGGAVVLPPRQPIMVRQALQRAANW